MKRNLLSTHFFNSSPKTTNCNSKSHELLVRGSFIKQSASGLYTLLPFGFRVLEKIQHIITTHLANIDAHRMSLPLILPAKHWKMTNRWESMGNEMFKLTDRKKAEYLLAPTHEEEITSLVATYANSVLPIKLFQIGQKFRDEARPRNGLLRAREFQMLDLYTFDATLEQSLQTYDQVSKAFKSIFKSIGIPVLVAEADSGDIGGNMSHEFHLVSPGGEDVILECPGCGYTANEERALGNIPIDELLKPVQSIYRSKEELKLLERITPLLSINPENVDFIYGQTEDLKVVFCILSGRDVNEIHIKAHSKLKQVKLGLPMTEKGTLLVVIDSKIVKTSTHSLDSIVIMPVTKTKEKDFCPKCNTPLNAHKAIEVGHTFHLSSKYSSILSAFSPPISKKIPFEMGCHGIGTTRLIGAIADTHSTIDGIIWPKSIAPYKCLLIAANESYNHVLEDIYACVELVCGPGECMIDNRDCSVKDKIKDASYVGYTTIIIVGKSYLVDKTVDFKCNGLTIKCRIEDLKRTLESEFM